MIPQALECDRLRREDRTKMLKGLKMRDWETLNRDVRIATAVDVRHEVKKV